MNKQNLPQQTNQNNGVDFLVGDVVAYTDEIDIDRLVEIEAYQPDSHWHLSDGNLARTSQIRCATVSELQAKRRLSEAELALAEVS